MIFVFKMSKISSKKAAHAYFTNFAKLAKIRQLWTCSKDKKIHIDELVVVIKYVSSKLTIDWT